jgi:signal transduction histidine kinase
MITQCISIIDRIDNTINTVRRIATELRPSVLDQLGLAAALEWQGQEFGSRTGIEVSTSIEVDGGKLPDDLESSAFRILQESLTNIARHAHATKVHIALQQTADLLLLEITDNGVGIARERFDETTSLGLIGMRERALACGGELNIVARQDRGTTVLLHVPLTRVSA